MCMNILPECISMYHVRAWCPWKAEEGKGIRSPEIRVMDGHEPPCRYQNLNLDPLQEQQMLLNTESSLQPQKIYFNYNNNFMAQNKVLSGKKSHVR